MDNRRGDPEATEDDPAGGGGEEEEEGDSSNYCPAFGSSALFQFMTTDAYLKFELGEGEGLGLGGSFRYVRPMVGRVGVLENPHGSVRLAQGSTIVVAAVYGPSDVRMSKELPHRAAVDVLFRPKVTGSGNHSAMIAAGVMDPVMEERAFEQTICGVLESVIHLEDHVQAGFNLVLHEFENDGCLLSTCLNACCLALINAGCSLRSLFAAVTFAVCGERIVVDPCAAQVQELKTLSRTQSLPFSVLTFVCTNSVDESGDFAPRVLHVSSKGVVGSRLFRACHAVVTKGEVLGEVFRFIKTAMGVDLGVAGRGRVDVGTVDEGGMEEDVGVDVEDDEEGEIRSDSGDDDL